MPGAPRWLFDSVEFLSHKSPVAVVHLHRKGCGSHFMNNLKAGDTIKLNTPKAYKYNDKARLEGKKGL